MAKPGPKPKPTHLKIIEGNPGNRPLNHKEPRPRKAIPKCPEWMDPIARAEWRRVTKELKAMGTLSTADRTLIITYCRTFSKWVNAEKVVIAKGYLMETPSGMIQANPYVGIANQAQKELRLLCAELGLTPSSRSRLVVEGVDEGDDFF